MNLLNFDLDTRNPKLGIDIGAQYNLQNKFLLGLGYTNYYTNSGGLLENPSGSSDQVNYCQPFASDVKKSKWLNFNLSYFPYSNAKKVTEEVHLYSSGNTDHIANIENVTRLTMAGVKLAFSPSHQHSIGSMVNQANPVGLTSNSTVSVTDLGNNTTTTEPVHIESEFSGAIIKYNLLSVGIHLYRISDLLIETEGGNDKNIKGTKETTYQREFYGDLLLGAGMKILDAEYFYFSTINTGSGNGQKKSQAINLETTPLKKVGFRLGYTFYSTPKKAGLYYGIELGTKPGAPSSFYMQTKVGVCFSAKK